MLPLPVQFLIALVLSMFNERMARRFEYLHEENRVLREVFTEVTGRKRIPFSDDQRRRLAIKGKELSPAERKACQRGNSSQDGRLRVAAGKRTELASGGRGPLETLPTP